jgi:hypothetical protein
VSFASQMQTAGRKIDARERDPWFDRVESYATKFEMLSTNALLEYLRARNTIHNARRLAPIMRTLGYIPTINRRMYPGGLRGTLSRGWTRPTRSEK